MSWHSSTVMSLLIVGFTMMCRCWWKKDQVDITADTSLHTQLIGMPHTLIERALKIGLVTMLLDG